MTILAVLLLLCAPSLVWAAPSISNVSGTITQGSAVTITGSAFGTKTNAGPMVYDDFDNGANNDDVESRNPQIHQGTLSSYAPWQKDGGGAYSGEVIRLNNTNPKSQSSLHARMIFDDSAFWGLNLYIPYTFTTGNELFISFYYRYAKTGAAHPRQTKAWISYSDAWSDKAYFSTAFDNCEGGGWRQHRTEPAIDNGLAVDGSEIDSEWVRFESYLKQSGANTANGAWTARIYRPTIGTPEIVENILSNVIMRTTSTNWTRWTFGGGYYDMCVGTNHGTIDVDEFYIDDTPARVEIGNASTLAASTVRELQRATAWSDTSITINLNRSHFADSATAYIFVYDSTGASNATGQAITIGGSGGGGSSTGGSMDVKNRSSDLILVRRR